MLLLFRCATALHQRYPIVLSKFGGNAAVWLGMSLAAPGGPSPPGMGRGIGLASGLCELMSGGPDCLSNLNFSPCVGTVARGSFWLNCRVGLL